MRRTRSLQIVLALAVGATLAGCESFDPTDMFNQKKPLPGDRRAVFPEGVPGVPQGVPKELVQGYQPPAEPEPAPAPPPEAEKPKPKPKRVAQPAPRPPRPSSAQPAQLQVSPTSGQPPQQQQQAAPWPAPQQAPQQTSQSPFPDPPAPGTFQR